MSRLNSIGAPRIRPVEQLAPEQEEFLRRIFVSGAEMPNMMTVLAHHDRLMRRFNVLAGAFLARGLLPPRVRELVILRVAWLSSSMYVFGQHTVIGRNAGLAEEEIRRVTHSLSSERWAESDRVVLTMVDEIVESVCISEETWEALAREWEDPELLELVMLAGFYRMVSGYVNSVGVQLDPGLPGWPDDV